MRLVNNWRPECLLALEFKLIAGARLLLGIIWQLAFQFFALIGLFISLLRSSILLLDMLARLFTDCHSLRISLILAGSDGEFTHKLHLRIGRVQDI